MEGVCRGESCVKGEENLDSNPVPSKDESILSGGNGAIWLGGGGDERLGKEGITDIKRPETFLEQIRHLSWRTARRTRDYKERLQAFRRQEQE